MEEIVESLENVAIDEKCTNYRESEEDEGYLLDDKISEMFLVVINFPDITLGSPEYLREFVLNYLKNNILDEVEVYVYENRFIYSIIHYLETYEADSLTKTIFVKFEEYMGDLDFNKNNIKDLLSLFNYIPYDYWFTEDYDVKINEILTDAEESAKISESESDSDSYVGMVDEDEDEYTTDFAPYNESNLSTFIQYCNEFPHDDRYFWILLRHIHLWNLNGDINNEIFSNIVDNLKICETQNAILRSIF